MEFGAKEADLTVIDGFYVLSVWGHGKVALTVSDGKALWRHESDFNFSDEDDARRQRGGIDSDTYLRMARDALRNGQRVTLNRNVDFVLVEWSSELDKSASVSGSFECGLSQVSDGMNVFFEEAAMLMRDASEVANEEKKKRERAAWCCASARCIPSALSGALWRKKCNNGPGAPFRLTSAPSAGIIKEKTRRDFYAFGSRSYRPRRPQPQP